MNSSASDTSSHRSSATQISSPRLRLGHPISLLAHPQQLLTPQDDVSHQLNTPTTFTEEQRGRTDTLTDTRERTDTLTDTRRDTLTEERRDTLTDERRDTLTDDTQAGNSSNSTSSGGSAGSATTIGDSHLYPQTPQGPSGIVYNSNANSEQMQLRNAQRPVDHTLYKIKTAGHLDSRGVLVPAPWMLGPKHVSNPA